MLLQDKVERTILCDSKAIRELPREVGVYLFLSDGGRILYVGKAKDLRSRVSVYFTDRVHHPRLVRLKREAASLRYHVTQTELDALLLEDDFIKKYRPPYNRMQKEYHRSVYVRVSRKEPYLGLAMEPEVDATYYGPFKDPWRIKEFVDLLSDYVGFRRSLLYEDVAERLPTREKVALVKAMFENSESTLLTRLVKRREIQSRLLQFESAARTQEKISSLQHVQRWMRLLKKFERPIEKHEIDKLIILSRHLART